MSPRLTEDIFQFANKPYNLRNYSLLLRKETGKFFVEQKVFLLKPQKSGNNHLSHLNMKKNDNNSQLNSKHRLRANVHVDCVKEYADHIGFI